MSHYVETTVAGEGTYLGQEAARHHQHLRAATALMSESVRHIKFNTESAPQSYLQIGLDHTLSLTAPPPRKIPSRSGKHSTLVGV